MEPYLVEQTAHGTEFRIPPESARRFARFGAGVMGLLGERLTQVGTVMTTNCSKVLDRRSEPSENGREIAYTQ